MIRIEVTPTVRDIPYKETSRGTYQRQTCYAYTVDRDGQQCPHPDRFEIFVGREGPKAPGMYKLMPQSIRVSRRGDLEIGYITLEPIEDRKPRAAAG